ncbi:MAG TPA: polyphosphate polymerase domain-containing protein [Fibrobacteria bacterium]|jgi:hypothetical protein|nr:polyphosphate polymerase domain-containing protein [Fibrobacteria bacterium]
MSRATPPVGVPGGKQAEMPAVLQRYELKYTIPRWQVAEVEDFIRPYVFMDAYSERCEGGFYRVNSLYLDSPDLLFLRTRICGAQDRFNMRVRTYGEVPGLPWFAEIKHKSGETVRKTRAVIRDADLEDVLLGAAREWEDPKLAEYRHHVLTYNARPWVQTSYQRKAFISHCDDYARVTFDIGLEYAPQERFDPTPNLAEMAPSDAEPLYDPETSVILELKCYTSYVPSWMLDLIRCFDLRRRGFSKYTAGMIPTLQRLGYDGFPFEYAGGEF